MNCKLIPRCQCLNRRMPRGYPVRSAPSPLDTGCQRCQTHRVSYAGRRTRFSGSQKPPEALTNLVESVSNSTVNAITATLCHEGRYAVRTTRVARETVGRTCVHRLPGHRMWWIFPGTSSALNFAGRSVARCGMCRSPMHSTRTIPAQGLFVAPQTPRYGYTVPA